MTATCDGGVTAGSRAEQRRRRVMDTARALFIANGFHATGMAQVAKLSGVAIGQIYRDFASKEEIVAALVGTDCARLMRFDLLEEAIRDRDSEAVRVWLRDFVSPGGDLDDARLFAEILAESSRSERIRAIFRSIQDDLRDHMDQALLLLAPSPAVERRRTVLAEVITTLSVGTKHQQLMRPDADLSSAIRGVQAVLDRELDALAAAGGVTYPPQLA